MVSSEKPEDIEFWNEVFKKLYSKNKLHKITWQSGLVDVRDKIDVIVNVTFVDTNRLRDINYQVKTKGYIRDDENILLNDFDFNLNIWQFDNYASGDYKIDALGLGINSKWVKMAIVFKYKDFIDLWCENRDWWVSAYEQGEYITLPVRHVLEIRHRKIVVRNELPF